MIAATPAAAHCCDGEELRVPGSPQPYARRVRGSWRDYLEPPGDGVDIAGEPYVYHGDSYDEDDDDDLDGEEEDSYDDSYGDDEEDGDEDCSCCSLCSSGGGGRRGRDTPPTSSRSSSSSTSSSSSSSTGSPAAAKAAANISSSASPQPPTHRHLSPVFEPSMRGSCRCIRCQKRRYSLDFFKSSDFRRGIPSPNVYMIDERSCKIVHDYIHDRDLQIGHRPANVVKDKKLNFVTWEPYFCVLLQDEQTLTAYRSEELSIFPGTALRTITHAFKLMERRQRSVGLQYPYGYHYNPIEPSINDLEGLNEVLDSRINTYKPVFEHVKMSTHDVNSVPRTHSYKPKNSLYDSEYMTVPDIPSLFPEDSYDYKYLGSPFNKFLIQPSTTESSIPINVVAIRKTSVFGYGFPTYKSPYSSDSMWSFGSKIPNTMFGDSQSIETDPEAFQVPSPTVTIVKLLPETLEQEPTTTTTKNPYDFLFVKLMRKNQNEVKNLVKDESNDEITQEIPTEDELNPITSEESQTVDQSNILLLEENLTEGESNSTTTEETQTEDESNSLVLEDTPIENESHLTLEETLTEDESNSVTTEKTQIEDELNSLVFDSLLAETESNSITTEDESNSITTEDESNSITTEDESNSIATEDESNSITTEDESNSITTEENQTEGDESKFTTSQETTTASKHEKWYSEYEENMQFKIMKAIENYQKFREQEKKPEFTTIDNIPAKSQSNLLSNEDNIMIQPFESSHSSNEVNPFYEYDK